MESDSDADNSVASMDGVPLHPITHHAFINEELFADEENVEQTGSRDWNWTVTFAEMQARKIERLQGGVYRKKWLRDNLMFAFVLAYTTVTGVVFAMTDPASTMTVTVTYQTTNYAWIVAGVMMIPLVILLKIELPPLIEMTFSLCAFTVLILLIIDVATAKVIAGMVREIIAAGGNPIAPAYDEQWKQIRDYYWKYDWGIAIVVGSIGIASVGILLSVYLWNYFILKWLIRRKRNDASWFKMWFGVRPTNDVGTYTYQSAKYPSFFFLPIPGQQEFFTYKGDLDKFGNADGQGTWIDSGGETVTGTFTDGLPFASWKSFVRDSSNAFVSQLIGVSRMVPLSQKWNQFCSTHPSRLTNSLSDKQSSLNWGLAACESSCSGSFFSHLPRASMVEPFGTSVETVASKLDTDPAGKEVLIFVHGWRTDCKWAVEVMGQFASFLNLDDDRWSIFVFNWPAGSFATFGKNQKQTSSTQYRELFVEFLRELIRIGYKKFHLVSHSMGSRLVSSLGVDRVLDGLFERVHMDSGMPRILSCVYFSPEIDSDEFILRFPGLRAFCSSIVLYTDKNDIALWSSGKIFGQVSVGQHPRHLFVDCAPDGSILPGGSRKRVRELPSNALGLTHSVIDVDVRYKRRYLDCDVVDNSNLDANVPFVRHSYFVFSRILADDVFDVLTDSQRRRAVDRARLMRREVNYYQFAVAPGYKKL
jgi:hypothetical protein